MDFRYKLMARYCTQVPYSKCKASFSFQSRLKFKKASTNQTGILLKDNWYNIGHMCIQIQTFSECLFEVDGEQTKFQIKELWNVKKYVNRCMYIYNMQFFSPCLPQPLPPLTVSVLQELSLAICIICMSRIGPEPPVISTQFRTRTAARGRMLWKGCDEGEIMMWCT